MLKEEGCSFEKRSFDACTWGFDSRGDLSKQEENTMNLDMTKGMPIKADFKVFSSVLLGCVFQQLYNMVDTIIVGKVLDQMHLLR